MARRDEDERLRSELFGLVPGPEELRDITAAVPFTREEWDRIRLGRLFEEADDKWLFCPEGNGLLIFRHFVGEVTFFWRAGFEPLEDVWLLGRLSTSRSNRSGEVFQSDSRQVGFAWYLIEMLLLKRSVWTHEPFYAAAEMLARQALRGERAGSLRRRSPSSRRSRRRGSRMFLEAVPRWRGVAAPSPASFPTSYRVGRNGLLGRLSPQGVVVFFRGG